jgi:hypothetical protein
MFNKFTQRTKLIRIIGDTDNQRPAGSSTTVFYIIVACTAGFLGKGVLASKGHDRQCLEIGNIFNNKLYFVLQACTDFGKETPPAVH